MLTDFLEEVLEGMSRRFQSEVGMGIGEEFIDFHIKRIGIMVRFPQLEMDQYSSPNHLVDTVFEVHGDMERSTPPIMVERYNQPKKKKNKT
jgi:hypothetical protein